jgi:DNA mismatch repair protein MutS2
MTERLLRFAGLDLFLEEFQPLTPEGKRAKEEYRLFYNRKELEKAFTALEKVIQFRRTNPSDTDKIEYHLKRIPLIHKRFVKGELRSELHSIKKFLHNYKAVSERLDPSLKSEMALTYNPEKLLKRLGYDTDQDERFFVHDSFSPDLKQLREEIGSLNRKVSDLREQKLAQIRKETSLDFRFSDFLVISEKVLPLSWDDFLFAEPYDSSSLIVKPLLGREFQEKHKSLSELLIKEKELENGILESLAEEVEQERENIELCSRSICSFDILLARASMAIRYDSVRPNFHTDANLKVCNLHLIPLEKQCNAEKVRYSSLTALFDARHIVISGSNMGGKTVVLKSILFAQLLAQMGFFIPCERFDTVIFESFNLIGDKIDSGKNGLSSFGEEIMSLIKARKQGKTLYIIDEFARTTNSREAFALTGALLEHFSEQIDIWSFSSTHQEELPLLENVSYWMMKGLDYMKYGEYFHKDFKGDLQERIALINNYMDYRIEPISDNSVKSRDALKIADILGLDSDLIEYAKKYIEKQEKQDEQ